MYTGKLIFAQAMEHLPMHTLRRCIQRYNGNRHVKRFSCLGQHRRMAFAQLIYRESLRDIEACLNARHHKLCHMGIRSHVARRLYANEDPGLRCDQTVAFTESRRSPSPSFTAIAGRWICSSNGSSNICASNHFSAPRRTPSRLRSGSPSPSMCWSPSSRSDSISRPVSIRTCRF